MRIDIEAVGDGVVIRCAGETCIEGVKAAMSRLKEFEAFGPDTPAVWDFSDALGQGLGADQMRTLGAHMSALRSGANQPRVSLLMGNEADFGGARMFVGLNERRLPSQYRVFRDRCEAYRWALGEEALQAGPT